MCIELFIVSQYQHASFATTSKPSSLLHNSKSFLQCKDYWLKWLILWHKDKLWKINPTALFFFETSIPIEFTKYIFIWKFYQVVNSLSHTSMSKNQNELFDVKLALSLSIETFFLEIKTFWKNVFMSYM